MRNWRALIVFASLSSYVACGNPSPSEIILDPKVQAALQDAMARANATTDAQLRNDLEGCAQLWASKAAPLLWDGNKPIYPPDNVIGTWSAESCKTVATSDKVPDGEGCTDTVTYTSEKDGQLDQSNQGEISSGSGLVSYIGQSGTGTSTDTLIVQKNHATGAGCEQDVVDLLMLLPEGTGRQDAAARLEFAFVAVINSTCPAPKWKCSVSDERRQ